VRLRVIAVGKDRSGLYAPAVSEYTRRIERYVRFELVELSDSGKRGGGRTRQEKGESALARIGASDHVVALDELGVERDSMEFARCIERWLGAGRDVAFLIGGAEGLSPPVLARANERLALSRMTLAHRLARLVLVEQLYRAMTIVRGEPYHK